MLHDLIILLLLYVVFTFFVPRGWAGRIVLYQRQKRRYKIREVKTQRKQAASYRRRYKRPQYAPRRYTWVA